MKVWRSFGSAHSADLCVVGEFSTNDDAQLIEQAVEDFVNAAWEERYPDVRAFGKAWETKLGGTEWLGPNQADFDMGLNDPCKVGRQGKTVKVSGITCANIGGIIKLMLLKSPSEVKVTGRTGP